MLSYSNAVYNGLISNQHRHSFTLMTWNILADFLATERAFSHSKLDHLDWSRRKHKIIQKVSKKDIACLQEVGMKEYAASLQPELNDHGYGSCYFPKTTKAASKFYNDLSSQSSNGNKTWFHPSFQGKTPSSSSSSSSKDHLSFVGGKEGPDEIGNAIFWRLDKFDALGASFIPLTDLWWKCRDPQH